MAKTIYDKMFENKDDQDKMALFELEYEQFIAKMTIERLMKEPTTTQSQIAFWENQVQKYKYRYKELQMEQKMKKIEEMFE
jgi:predicted membrane GTPase involved in stress response